jgi:glycine/D-amino acid oxidase-like deaminating enzyme
MTQPTAAVVICGAGIAGVSAAYHLAVRNGVKNVVLVDERPPLTLTSDKSTECYRNWWPGPDDAMVRYMNRSIDILEDLARESGNIFNLNRRGYVFATANPDRIEEFKRSSEESASLGAGPVRYHAGQPGEPAYVPAPTEGFEDQPTGADIITDPALIRDHFPYLAEETVGILHPRRCGWLSAQQYGMYMLEQAQAHGVKLIEGRVEGVQVSGNRVQTICLAGRNGSSRISTDHFIIAAGPFVKDVAGMIGVDLPVYSELHVKVAFSDHLGVFPRQAPLIIWVDPVQLPWDDDEKAFLAESEETSWLLEEFPAGVHGRPEGGADSPIVLLLWTYDIDPVEPTFPLTFDPNYPEIVLRGMSVMVPSLTAYFNRAPKPVIDGGYYTKTRENRPLIGPLPVEGAYIFGALSGFGQMASSAGAEMLAAHVTGSTLPGYAPAFALTRYEDPAYQKLLDAWGASGQL